MSLTDRLASALAGRLSRRSFVVRSAFAGSALAAGGARYLLEPGTAYASLCLCGQSACGCGSTCCAGYTEFCCVINGGYNYCPVDTVMGGWWKAEGSIYCDGPRYYMDCNATCECQSGCGDGYGFCEPGCDGGSCGCAGGDCDNYLTDCFQFRYGQCNQQVSCIGRITCRVVTCVPPWEIDPSCTTVSAEDDYTANQNAACLTPGPTKPPPVCASPSSRCEVVAIAPTPDTFGYTFVTSFGRIFGFGDAHYVGEVHRHLAEPVVGLAASPLGGYWMTSANGRVFAFGAAPWLGDAYGLYPRPTVAVAARFDGQGYWLLTAAGRVTAFGSAPALGGAQALSFPTPFVAMAATPTGNGYWLVTGGGRVLGYGDAALFGDLSAQHLAGPVVGIAVAPGGTGYWLVTAAGGVHAFGSAPYHGSVAGRNELPYPVVGMAANRSGNGYWLATGDGRALPFGNAAHYGNVH